MKRNQHLIKAGNSKRLSAFLKIHNINILSIDIFDTLLFRNHKPEVYRFREVCELHRYFFKKIGYDISSDCLFSARMNVHKIGYRTAPIVKKYRDASITHIFNLYLYHLGIPPSFDLIHDLIEIEIEYEKNNLRLNIEIYNLAVLCKEQGIQIFFISDMYFHKEHLEKLIIHFCPECIHEDIYVSSEFSAAKNRGILFDIFIKNEGIEAHQLLHIGDNILSDHLVPKSKGIHSVYAPRALCHCLIGSFYRRYKHYKERFFLG